MKFFVYTLSTDCRPIPAIWHDKLTDGNGKPQATLLCVQLKPNEENLKINELVKLYPWQGSENAVNGVQRNNQDDSKERNTKEMAGTVNQA